MIIVKNIDYTQFEGIEYDPSKVNEYLVFWEPYLNQLDLTEQEKIDVAKGWQYGSILYANDKSNISKQYQIFDVTMYIMIVQFVKSGESNVDWPFIFQLFERVYPDRHKALDLLSKHRHRETWERMQDNYLSNLIAQVQKILTKMRNKGQI